MRERQLAVCQLVLVEFLALPPLAVWWVCLAAARGREDAG
jgi:hypothetical protein